MCKMSILKRPEVSGQKPKVMPFMEKVECKKYPNAVRNFIS